MTEVLNTSFFDPIAGYIRLVKPDENYIEIEVAEEENKES